MKNLFIIITLAFGLVSCEGAKDDDNKSKKEPINTAELLGTFKTGECINFEHEEDPQMEQLLDYAPYNFYNNYSMEIEYRFQSEMLEVAFITYEGFDCMNLIIEEKINVDYRVSGNTLTGTPVAHLVQVPHQELAENLRKNSACQIDYWSTNGPFSLLNTNCFQGETANVSIELKGDELIIDEGLSLFRQY